MPGQSMRYMRFMSVMYCHTFVSPGIGAVVQTFFFRSVLMMDDLPVFGYPMKPTEICLRLLWSEENCRSVLIRLPLPKELVKEAWNARHGWSRLRSLTHRACRYSQQVFRES